MQVFLKRLILFETCTHKLRVSGQPIWLDSAPKCIYWTVASKSSSNLWDNSTLKTTHPCTYIHHTHTHLYASIEHPHLQRSSQIQDIISTHAPQCMWHPFVVMENGNVCYHYLCILFCAHVIMPSCIIILEKKAYQHLVCLLVWFSNDFISDGNL